MFMSNEILNFSNQIDQQFEVFDSPKKGMLSFILKWFGI